MNTAPSIANDENAIRAIIQQMADAWNTGDSEAFAAVFADDADFVAFEATHLQGRQEIAAFHKEAFDTVVKGTRLQCRVKFIRFLSPELAVMHSHAEVTLPGQAEFSPSRDSMELFVVRKRNGSWQAQAMMNGRRLTMEWQLLLDDFVLLSEEAQRRVTDFVTSLSASITDPKR